MSRAPRAVDDVLQALDRFTAGTPQPWLLGSPCFEPPPALQAAVRAAAARPHFHYAPLDGLPQLREAIALLHRRAGEDVAPDDIVITNGAKCGLLAVLAALLDPDDEVIHPVPCYPAYPGITTTLGARPVPLPEQEGEGFAWQRHEIERLVSDRTRVLVLSSPSNPTGSTLTGSQSEMLVELCRDHGVVLICDETYEAFRFAAADEPQPGIFDPELATVVRIRTFSKTFGVCGWRIGYLIANQSVKQRVVTFQAGALNPAGTLPQMALASLQEISPEFAVNARGCVSDRLSKVLRAITQLGLRAAEPGGGFYLWADVRHLLDQTRPTSRIWCRDLAEQEGLGFWPGEDFGGDGWVRISVVADPMPRWQDSLDELQQRLGRFFSG